MNSAKAIAYVDDLFRYAMALARNPHEAEDLVQETYLRALKAMASLRPESNLKGWLFAILRNAWLNQLRHRRGAPPLVGMAAGESDAHSVPERSKDPLAQYESKIEIQQVREAIEQLPAEFREVVILREYEQMTYEEIAEILHCPPGTVMSRLARARGKLRALLVNRWWPMRAGEPSPCQEGTI